MAAPDANSQWLSSVTLSGSAVCLAPLSLNDADALHDAAGSPETFRYFADSPASWDIPAFRAWLGRLLAAENMIAFCVKAQPDGRPIGITSYLDIRPKHRGVEIGWTWLAPAFRGTRANPDMKRLLLSHAFDDHDALRVQLKTDLRNLQSQRAIEKLGAHREGVLRDNIIMPDGHVRSTVMYSITANQWPQVREALDRRLAG